MTKVGSIRFVLLFCFITSTTLAQKVKYKDIFGLLTSKQYEQAEPFLKKYVSENDDNPNAFLYMGIIYQEKSGKNDPLKQTQLLLANMDSAVFFYDKANKSLDEKEVRKNKEYYQLYNRRDLRTGEFGVKLSDIQFDLEKKIEGLRERTERLKMVKYYFNFADSLYKKSNALFQTIQSAYAGQKEFYLRADENTLKDLAALSVRFDSCVKNFENYKASLQNLGKTSYNQSLRLTDIADFKKDGTTLADFYADEVKLWDYKKFASSSKEIIEKEIIPIKEHLVSYDIEINKLREKLNNDSVSVKNDLTKLIDKLLLSQLKKFDPDPLPMNIFAIKIADLEYRSSILENKSFRDSSDIHLHLRLLHEELEYLNDLDSLAGKLNEKNIDPDVENYDHFITNSYNNSVVLKSYIKALKEFAEREKRKKDKEMEKWTNALSWLKVEADSVPLSLEETNSRFKPLALIEEKYTAGLAFADSVNASGYFYTITSSRIPDVNVSFPVDKPNFREKLLPVTKALTYADPNGQIYFVLIYSEKLAKDKYPVSLAKIYRSDGLSWSNNYQLAFVPKEILFKPDSGELTIKSDDQQTVIDKNGKIIMK